LNDATRYNLYRGDLLTLLGTGAAGMPAYTQGTVPPATQVCSLIGTTVVDTQEPTGPGEGLFYLVTAENDCGEGTLGADSAGAPRANLTPCP
jgi:hypothetical protein